MRKGAVTTSATGEVFRWYPAVYFATFTNFHLDGVYTNAVAALAAFVHLSLCMIENSHTPVEDGDVDLLITLMDSQETKRRKV